MAGKGRKPEGGVDWKKIYKAPLWDNFGPNKKPRKGKKKKKSE